MNPANPFAEKTVEERRKEGLPPRILQNSTTRNVPQSPSPRSAHQKHALRTTTNRLAHNASLPSTQEQRTAPTRKAKITYKTPFRQTQLEHPNTTKNSLPQAGNFYQCYFKPYQPPGRAVFPKTNLCHKLHKTTSGLPRTRCCFMCGCSLLWQ